MKMIGFKKSDLKIGDYVFTIEVMVLTLPR